MALASAPPETAPPETAPPETAPPNTSCAIVLDWDDTLLPTTWLQTWLENLLFPHNIPPEVLVALQRLDVTGEALLSAALQHGAVTIVTNAQRGWVEVTSALYLPRVCRLIADRHVPVISARTTFESKFPTDPIAWKAEAYRSCLERCVDPCRDLVSLLSIGDSTIERDAVHRVALQMGPRILPKVLKLAEKPLISQLRCELEFVATNLATLASRPLEADIVLASTLTASVSA